MANQFFNGQVMTPTSGCGTPSQLPGVAVYNPEVTCPGAGYGASTYVSPATPLAVGLTLPIAKFTFAASSGERNVLFGNLCQASIDVLQTELGITIVSVSTDGVATLNQQAKVLNAFWCESQATIVGLVGKTNGSIDSLSATQVAFSPCAPCFTSDTDFVCANGCNDNSNFILTNAVVGGANALIVNIPANTAIKFDVCSCAPQVNAFASCNPSVPSIAQIATGVTGGY